MAGTPPARAETPSGPSTAPRFAIEHLPLPFLIFEPSLRLNFINAAARRFFNLDTHLHNPEALGLSASDLFGEDVQFKDADDPAPGDSFETGEWNERIRILECRRRHKPDSPPVGVRAAVGPFVPGADYFGMPQSSRPATGCWYSVMLLSTPSSPASSSASTLTPSGPSDRLPARRNVHTAFSQFAASASARQPVVLRGSPHSRGAVMSPGNRALRQIAPLASPGSFFPTTPASVASATSSGSSGPATSSYAPSLTESSKASTADSTAPSLGEVSEQALPQAKPVLPRQDTEVPSSAHSIVPPPPSQTSAAAAVIQQSRAIDRQKERERDARERAEEDDRRTALTQSPRIPVAATAEPPQRPQTPVSRVAAEATTAMSPSTSFSAPSTHPLNVLTHAALSHLPRTGIILASNDLSGGYVNDMARELLLGVRPKAPLEEEGDSDWIEDGIWIAQPGPGGRWTWDGAEFFRGLDASAPVSAEDAADTDRAAAQTEDTASTSAVTSGDVVIGLPTQLYKMTVATILQRSVKLSKIRRKAIRKRATPGSTSVAAAALEELVSESKSSPQVGASPKASTSTAPLGAGFSETPTTASNLPKKPYKVYDATFYQRIIDPLEPLLEMCARKGENPDASLGGHSGITIGLEVDIGDDSELAPDTFETTTLGASKRKVRRRLVEVRGSVVRSPQGNHLGGMLVLRDVTDDKSGDLVKPRSAAVGRAAEADNEYFKQILDQMPQMVWTTTPQGSHDYFNNQWYEYTGLEPEQSLGLGWQNPFHDDDMPHTIKAWSHSLATGDPYSVEYRCRRYDGAWRWMLGRALPMRDSEGKITGWFGTCTDIEDAVNIRAQLLRTREQFMGVLNGADVTIISTDAQGKIVLVEGSDASMFRRGDIEPYGHSFRDLWPKDPQVDEMMTYVANETITTGRCESRGPNGHPYRLMMRLRGSNGSDISLPKGGSIIVLSDIGDLKDAERALEQSALERVRLETSEAAAREASRLKSSWLANTTHEVRTPISAMVGLAELLLDDPALAPTHRELVERIVRSCEILLEMIGMVLDMGKVEAGKLDIDEHEFWLRQLLTDVRIFSHAAQRKGLQFIEETNVTYDGPLLGDMPRLRQILGNVLSNAIKFTSEGSVTMRTTSSDETDDTITMTFTCIDTGIGIRAEAQSSLFQPFHQAETSTARKFGGTGLGLSIAKSLIELMGGSISMSSTYLQGTTMTIRIRFEKLSARQKSPPLEPAEPDASDVTIDRASTHILLAEDNQLNRDIVVKLLERLDFKVRAVSNGLDALDALAEQEWSLVLMDGQMPDLDGYETTKRIRASNDPRIRDIKVVALTASALQGEKERCLEAGMDDYIAKPVRLRELEAVILKHLAAKARSSPRLSQP